MAGSHSGRTVLVTGASSGLGEAFARDLAASGARVVLAARRVDRLEALIADLAAKGCEAMAVAMDVVDPASVAAAFDAAQARFGVIDTVIANAGVNIEGRAIDMTAADVDSIFSVNVKGAFLTLTEGARRLFAAGAGERGRFVVVASMGGNHVLPGLVTYCASKAAVVMMGKGLAQEWAKKGLCVNVLCPGYIRTEINQEWFDSEAGQKMVAAMPRRRLMPPESLLPTVSHLTSDAAAFMTGAVIEIMDGQVA